MDQSSINEINLYPTAQSRSFKIDCPVSNIVSEECMVADRRTGGLGGQSHNRLPPDLQLHNYRRPTSRHIHACSQLRTLKEVEDLSCTLKIKIEIFRNAASEGLTSPTDDFAIASCP